MDPEPSYEVRFADPAEPPLLDGEEWRTVDANGAAVSSHGRYRNSRGVVNTPTPARSGYVSVTISGKSTSMHRAVAEAFGLPGQSAERCQVNHTDGDRSNNRLENLEWVSAAENVKHSHDTNAQRRQCGPRQSKPVEARRLGTDKWVRFASTAEAAQALGLSSDCVSSCARGRQQRCGDYELRFADPTEPSMLDGEEWRTVGSRGAAVSSCGRYRDCRGVVRTPQPVRSGYVSISIAYKKRVIHRVIAEAFDLPGRTAERDEINHIDGNPSNNHLSNLEWVSRSENIRQSYATNMQRRNGGAHISKPVEIRRCGSDCWVRFASMSEATRALGLTEYRLRACAQGKQKRVSRRRGTLGVRKGIGAKP